MDRKYLWYFYQLAFIAAFTLTYHTKSLQAESVSNHEPVCMTEDCKKTADRLLMNMNQNADPCNSFYQFACGKWPDEKQDVLRVMKDNILHKLKELLDATSLTENSSFTKVKRFYESCLNKDNSIEKPISDILKIIDENGGWPLIITEQEWLLKKKSWQEIDVAYRKITNFSPLYTIKTLISSDKNKAARIMFKMTTADSDEQIFSGDLLENFEDFMMLPQAINYKLIIKNISQIFINNREMYLTKENIDEDVKNIIRFEWELEWIKNQTMNGSVNDITKQLMAMKFKSFQRNLNSMNFNTTNGKIDFLNMTKQYFDVLPGSNISESQEIFAQSYYFWELANLLDRTPSEVIVNTLHWHFIKIIARKTSKRLNSVLQYLLLPSIREKPFKFKNKSDICLSYTIFFLPHLTSCAYIKKYSSQRIIDKNVQMIKRIMDGMENVVTRTHLPDILKTRWLKKMNNLGFLVGYPHWYKNWIQNETQLDNEYKDLNISESFFDNVLATSKFGLIKKLEEFRDNDYSRNIWKSSPLTVNAFYNHFYHAIVLLYGILQNPFFDIGQPEVLNYGGIGHIIGHEITHSFYSSIGNPYYKNGTEKEWFPDITDEIQDQIRCVVERYSNYSIFINNKTHHMDPYLTLKENLADILSVQASYEAFQIYKENDTESRIRLPGLEHLNTNQLYFLSYASVRCTSKNNYELTSGLRDTHTPSVFRVDGAFSSSSIFAEAFQCPKGTRMNPERKCSLSSE